MRNAVSEVCVEDAMSEVCGWWSEVEAVGVGCVEHAVVM